MSNEGPTSPTGGDPKGALRERMKGVLNALSAAHRRRESDAVTAHLLDFTRERLPRRAGGGVMVFAPIRLDGRGPEIDISGAASAWIAEGRAVGVPDVEWASRTIRCVRVRDWERDLELTARNAPLDVRTPRPGLEEIASEDLGLVLVPGLAFDRSGGRLGRGAGFYDRFLASLRAGRAAGMRAALMGVCFEEQWTQRVPTEPHDVRVDWVATPRGIVDTACS